LSPTERHALLDCFVLHRRDYGNSSLLLEVFSRAEGRFPVLAKGAKRQRNAPAALLQLFTPLLIAVSGRGEVKTMIQLEPAAAAVPLTGAGLYCGFYLNELLMRLVGRNDPHQTLFDAYIEALAGLAKGDDLAAVLLGFVLQLLTQTGYAMVLDQEAGSRRPVDPEARYVYHPESGLQRQHAAAMGWSVSGRTLLALANKRVLDAQGRHEAKVLMRTVLSYHLGERPVKSRELFRPLFVKDG
jgi:DNA repair protein RecO (recombination protein O)